MPLDDKGEPMFERAESAELGWDALVEFCGGDAVTAKEIADTMVEEKRKELEKAQKRKPQGKTPTEILASKKANVEALTKAEAELAQWEAIARMSDERTKNRERRSEVRGQGTEQIANSEQGTEVAEAMTEVKQQETAPEQTVAEVPEGQSSEVETPTEDAAPQVAESEDWDTTLSQEELDKLGQEAFGGGNEVTGANSEGANDGIPTYERKHWSAESDVAEMRERRAMLDRIGLVANWGKAFPQYEAFDKERKAIVAEYGSADKVPQEVTDALTEKYAEYLDAQREYFEEVSELNPTLTQKTFFNNFSGHSAS